MEFSLTPDMFLLIPVAIIALFLVRGPFRDRQLKAELAAGDAEQVHFKIYRETGRFLWITGMLSVACWLLSGRGLGELGFQETIPGWRSWVAWGGLALSLIYVAYSLISVRWTRSGRVAFRKEVSEGGDIDLVRPTTPREHLGFQLLSITAGINEEIIFRGFLIGVMAMFMPIWVAAIATTLLFILAHIYQGIDGMMRILPISVIMATIFVIGGSLWPVIILHIVVDSAAGFMIAWSDRFEDQDSARSDEAALAV